MCLNGFNCVRMLILKMPGSSAGADLVIKIGLYDLLYHHKIPRLKSSIFRMLSLRINSYQYVATLQQLLSFRPSYYFRIKSCSTDTDTDRDPYPYP
jgi:hypothetical protein